MSRPARKRITRLDIAQKAGVSPSTVSRALAGHPAIPDSTKKRIERIADTLGYVPSQLGKSYYHGKSYRLAFLMRFGVSGKPLIASEYFAQTFCGFMHGAEKR